MNDNCVIDISHTAVKQKNKKKRIKTNDTIRQLTLKEEKKQTQKNIKPNNGKESGTKFTWKQSAQDKHDDKKKYLQKQHIKGGEWYTKESA